MTLIKSVGPDVSGPSIRKPAPFKQPFTQPDVAAVTSRTLHPATAADFSAMLRALQPSLLFAGRREKGSFDDFQPMLAQKVELENLQYPVIISPKIDGNRGLVKGGKLLGRSLSLIPNPLAQRILGRPELEGFDGELVASEPTDPAAVGKATGFFGKTKANGNEFFRFWVFDLWNEPDKPFAERLRILKKRVAALPKDVRQYVQLVPQIRVKTEAEILAHEKQWLGAGYEGVIVRSPKAPYLNTRSSMEDQGYLKLKRFLDAEAIVTGVRPVEPKSPLGKSLLAEGYTAADLARTLAGYEVRDLKTGARFRLGAGNLSVEQRQQLWRQREQLIDKVVKYKYFPVGMNPKTQVPRHPGFLGFREDHDMPADLLALIRAMKSDMKEDGDAA